MPLCIYFVADDVLLFACCLVEKWFILPKQGARPGGGGTAIYGPYRYVPL